MKVKEKLLAFIRHYEQKHNTDISTMECLNYFNWHNTKESSSFWSMVFKKEHPSFFKNVKLCLDEYDVVTIGCDDLQFYAPKETLMDIGVQYFSKTPGYYPIDWFCDRDNLPDSVATACEFVEWFYNSEEYKACTKHMQYTRLWDLCYRNPGFNLEQILEYFFNDNRELIEFYLKHFDNENRLQKEEVHRVDDGDGHRVCLQQNKFRYSSCNLEYTSRYQRSGKSIGYRRDDLSFEPRRLH